MALAQDVCFTCARGTFLECATDPAGPRMRVPGFESAARNVTEGTAVTVCNADTNWEEQEVCEGPVSTSWTITVDQCNQTPLSSYFVRGDCKYFFLQHPPFDGTQKWQWFGRVGPFNINNYDKETELGASFNISLLGEEVRPASF